MSLLNFYNIYLLKQPSLVDIYVRGFNATARNIKRVQGMLTEGKVQCSWPPYKVNCFIKKVNKILSINMNWSKVVSARRSTVLSVPFSKSSLVIMPFQVQPIFPFRRSNKNESKLWDWLHKCLLLTYKPVVANFFYDVDFTLTLCLYLSKTYLCPKKIDSCSK